MMLSRPSHRPYYFWPTVALRVISLHLHPWMPWRALAAHMELLYRADPEINAPIAVSLRAGARKVSL
jgi:hypothetical protein